MRLEIDRSRRRHGIFVSRLALASTLAILLTGCAVGRGGSQPPEVCHGISAEMAGASPKYRATKAPTARPSAASSANSMASVPCASSTGPPT